MDLQSRCAFVIAQAACANARVAAMQAANAQAQAGGNPPLYKEEDFDNIENTYMISHNAVIDYLR